MIRSCEHSKLLNQIYSSIMQLLIQIGKSNSPIFLNDSPLNFISVSTILH